MNHASEHDIDRVLTGLRDTEPSEGMERRILQALESRTPARSTWFRWTPPMQWGIATLATAAVVFAVALTAHNTRRPTSDIAQSPVPMPSQNAVISTEASRPHATRSGENAAFAEANATRTPTHLKSAGSSMQPTYPPHELLCDCDRLAMAEMQAPSQPAPEMPLTAQERLLQRVVHHGDPVEIAELEPLRNEPRLAAVPRAEDAALKHVVQDFLKQLAATEALNPTPPTPPADSDSGSNDPSPAVESSTSPN